MARLLEIVKSKAFQAGLLLAVFFATLGSGLAYLVREHADNAQLTALEGRIHEAREPVVERFGLLEEDVREALRRVVYITSEVMKEANAPREEEAGEQSAAPRPVVLPLEERWRIRLAASLGDVLEARSDVLDVTYLGRFSGVPSGSLMVARVERGANGGAAPTQEDPRPDWDGTFLQEVISHEGDDVILAEPRFETPNKGETRALVRGATPVRGSEGSVVGVVLVSVDLSETLLAVRAALDEETTVLLATEAGASLLNPVDELALTRGQSAEKLLAAAFYELEWAARRADQLSNYGFVGSNRAERLLRFEVGTGAKKLAFTLAIGAPIADVDLVAMLGGSLGGALLFGVVVLAIAGGAGFWWWKKRRGAADDAEAAEAPSELEARADAIAADAEAEPSDAAEEPESRADDVDDESAVAEDDADARAVPEADEADAFAADAEGESPDEDEAAEEDPPVAEAPAEAPDPLPEQPEEPEREAPVAANEAVVPEVPAATPAPASSPDPSLHLAEARSRLEDELEAARQRALDELAAARERFEAELAAERERAIERLVEESRESLARELGNQVDAAVATRRPALEPCEFDLRQLLSEVAAWLEGEAYGRDVPLGVRCSRQVPERLLGDPEWVGPLLVHLARGAMQSSPSAPVELFVSCDDDGPNGVKLCFEIVAPESGLYVDEAGELREVGASGPSLAEELVDAMHGDLMLARADDQAECVRVVLPMPLPH